MIRAVGWLEVVSKVINLDCFWNNGWMEMHFFVYSVEIRIVRVCGALSCVWRQWSIYRNRREGYAGKL